MKATSSMILGRTALAIAVLIPSAACAEPADQATPPNARPGTAMRGVTQATFVSRHHQTLLAADTDGDGEVSRAEFVAVAKPGRKDGPKAGGADPARRFAKLDTSGDGLLDSAEIDAMLLRRFKRLDANGDGMLGADERAAAHARRTGVAGVEPKS